MATPLGATVLRPVVAMAGLRGRVVVVVEVVVVGPGGGGVTAEIDPDPTGNPFDRLRVTEARAADFVGPQVPGAEVGADGLVSAVVDDGAFREEALRRIAGYHIIDARPPAVFAMNRRFALIQALVSLVALAAVVWWASNQDKPHIPTDGGAIAWLAAGIGLYVLATAVIGVVLVVELPMGGELHRFVGDVALRLAPVFGQDDQHHRDRGRIRDAVILQPQLPPPLRGQGMGEQYPHALSVPAGRLFKTRTSVQGARPL